MPEYLAPGVYVEEFDTGTPIAGVPTSTVDYETARALIAAVEPIIRRAQPQWAGFDDPDPGVTLVQLLAWVAEGLTYRAGADGERTREAVLRAAAELAAVAGACATRRATLKRPSFFAGQLIDAATLESEQDYLREKQRRHNRNLHGFGIVSGLDVRVEATSDSDAARIVVEPGYAIDRCGEEIALPVGVRLAAPADGDATFVSLRHWEHSCEQPPARAGDAIACIEEACLVAIVRDVSPSSLAIARLVRSDGRWTIDASFAAPRPAST